MYSRSAGKIRHFFLYHLSVLQGRMSHWSVRKQLTGRPSEVKRFGMEWLGHPNRTATGFLTCFDETTTVLPSMRARAGTNFLSSPAICNSVSSFPLDTRPVGTLSNQIRIRFFSNAIRL